MLVDNWIVLLITFTRLVFVDGSIPVSSLVISATFLLLSALGLFIGGRLGGKFGKRMELIGGLVLIGIGLRVLISHIMG